MKNELNKEYTDRLTEEGQENKSSLFQVLVHNDDFTPMEFVVGILEKFFFMDRSKAMNVMMQAHVHGKALCGIYSNDVAETKILEVLGEAQQREYPLRCSMEVA